ATATLPSRPSRPMSSGRGQPVAGVYLRLTVDWKMVGILTYQDAGQERRSGAAALDRQRQHRGLGDRLTRAAEVKYFGRIWRTTLSAPGRIREPRALNRQVQVRQMRTV